MSPLSSGRDEGMPCTTCSFTDAQTVAGYPWYPLNAGSAPASRTRRSASSSMSDVRDAGHDHLPQLGENPRHELIHPPQLVNLALGSADNHECPLYRFAAAASSIIAFSSMRHTLGRLCAVDDTKRRTPAVVIQHRPRRLLIDPQTLEHDLLIIVRPLHELTAAFLQRPSSSRTGVGPAHRTNPAARQAPHQFLLRHCHVHNDERTRLQPLHQLVERLRLRNSPRKTVQHEALPASGLASRSATMAIIVVVIDELTAVHPRLRRRAPSGSAP